MVDSFHEAGLEVYLDVVFNHTAEGGDDGPTYSFRGLDNALYYMLDADGKYLNFSGCGNTFSNNHPVVRNYVIDCLRSWVAEGGVDGFRFDLASILGRDQRGNPVREPRVVDRISEDSLLARHETDRRAVGCRWALPGGHVFRATAAGRTGTAAIATTSGGSGEVIRAWCRRSPPESAAVTISTGIAGHSLDQLHNLPRWVHPARPGFVQPEAQ